MTEVELCQETAQVIRFNDGVFEECVCKRREVGEGDGSTKFLWVDVNTSKSDRDALAEEFVFDDILSTLVSLNHVTKEDES